MEFQAYPLEFEPILKENIWGGDQLKKQLNKQSTSDKTGESWEISAVENSVSVVNSGRYTGKSLTQLLDDFPEQVLGSKVFAQSGAKFPLLFKFIDAHQDLSIQVHPSDEVALKRHNSLGKTEMWYIMNTEPGAKITIGFKKSESPDSYVQHLEQKTLFEILNQDEVHTGDVYYLKTGTVHSIGKGILLAEIQQTSDITYRIYDFDRVDDAGKPRQLHIDEALDVIDYNPADAKIEYNCKLNISNAIISAKYFTTNFIKLDGEMEFTQRQSSFRVYMCVDNSFTLAHNNKLYSYKKGDTVLIPAAMSAFSMQGTASLLEIYIS